MKKKIWITCFLFLFCALIFIGAGSCSKEQPDTAMNCDEQLITVLNPAISSNFAERVPLTPRTGSLDGKTIYLVDLQWGGPEAGYSVFEEMKDWFSKNMPSVKIEVRRSKGGWMGDDPDLRQEIVAKAGGAVIGIGG
jgi:hypothetical protein